MKRIISFLLCLTMLIACSASALAAGSEVTYDADADKFVFVQSADLFQNFKGIMPGDVLTQDITVKNDASNGVKVKIYLRADPVEEQYRDFLSQMTLKAVQDGDSVLFLSAADEQGGLADDVCLGTFYSGAEVNLEVLLTVPVEMGNEFQDGIGVINWVFTAEELPIEPDDPTPKTGDTSDLTLYIILATVSVAAILLLIVKHAKRADKN